ncbi:OmpH family outer membrane protein [Chryseobacterium viscerum]|uniref:OmpH family outer membrane protein n=1 Tax=Chryseobacterium viscerum TaxID=1037377 RepID=A0A316WT57_9FLAO|nr:OmpH family outer membrane protein [Chryseobacterium viscerum]KAB1230401.1 OmpH family outer membrane protein [Chryseobacterium viscerum]PWN61720.1 OmpH family outer membrane protein [Chryseobacterium viscerum]
MNLTKVLFIAAGLTLSANAANAQQKIGSVNTEEVFASLSEVKTIGATIDSFTKTKQTEIEKLIAEYQTKLKTAQDKEKTLSEANKEAVTKELIAAQTELQTLGKKIEETRGQAAKDISNKQNELLSPLQQKVRTAIFTVAKEKNLSYVFDTASQDNNNLLYTDGSEDITSLVKTKLGGTTTAAKPAGKSK